jgi:hypothetical protein
MLIVCSLFSVTVRTCRPKSKVGSNVFYFKDQACKVGRLTTTSGSFHTSIRSSVSFEHHTRRISQPEYFNIDPLIPSNLLFRF